MKPCLAVAAVVVPAVVVAVVGVSMLTVALFTQRSFVELPLPSIFFIIYVNKKVSVFPQKSISIF